MFERKKEHTTSMNTRDELIQNVVSTMRNQTKKMQLSVIPTLKSYIPLNEFLALHLLYKEGNHIVSEIAEHMHISNSSMTCISDRLMEREFVTRVRSQKDRRVVYLSITDKGKAFAEEMEKVLTKEYGEKLGHFTDEELQTFLRLLNKMDV